MVFGQNIPKFQDICNMAKNKKKTENDKIPFLLKINKK